MKSVAMSTRRVRMAGDLLWFASASLAAGLLAAIAIALLAMLLAQPAYAADAAGFQAREACSPAEDVSAEDLTLGECSHAFVLILGREEELDRLGLECETGVEGGVHPAEHGFFRLLDRERRELGYLLRYVDGSLLDSGVTDELTDEAHVIRLAGARDVAGEDVAHCLVFADRARDALRAALRAASSGS